METESLNGCSYCGNGECAVCGRKFPPIDDVLHGLDMAEIFVIKNAHAKNAATVLGAIKEAQAIIRSAV